VIRDPLVARLVMLMRGPMTRTESSKPAKTPEILKAAQTSALGARTPAHTGRYVNCRVSPVGATSADPLWIA
jgi:hypothetical protein